MDEADIGMVVGLSPGEFVLDGDPAKRGRAPSPILRVDGLKLRISKLDRKWGHFRL